MMDTVLNVGLNSDTLKGFTALMENKRVAWEAYRRLIQMFSNIVKGIERHQFEEILDKYKARTEGGADTDLSVPMLQEIVTEFKNIYEEALREPFPDDPLEQLRQAIGAVFESWYGAPATAYRKAEGLPDDWGTAVNVQTMVFGNMGETSGTGVAFTRNPATGENEVWGEYLLNAQGEDVVAGIRTPNPISAMADEMPERFDEFIKICRKLENHYRDMQDMEFTIERGKLWMLQTRTGKRTARAAVKIAVDMVAEKLITKNEALLRVAPDQINQFLHPRFSPEAIQDAKNEHLLLAVGLNASPGAASGKTVFDANRAAEQAIAGEPLILVRPETHPDDVQGMVSSKGILTQRGGMTCVAGESKLLTDQGFMTAEEAFLWFASSGELRILAFDSENYRTMWRKVVAAGQRIADVQTISVSQTGRAKSNTLRITPSHKMFTVNKRQLMKKELKTCLEDDVFLCIIDQIPTFSKPLVNETTLAYTTGAILTDGYVNLKPTKGSVTFIQKQTPEKERFIEAVRTGFADAFGYPFTYQRHRQNRAFLQNRVIEGESQDLICFHQEPAQILSETWNNLVPWILTLDEESLKSFLAGFNETSNRIHIYIGKEELLQGVIVACLRLGILPQITNNRDIFNVQIPAGFSDLLNYTNRVSGSETNRLYSHRLFSVRSLFKDIANEVNYKGRVKEAIKRNLLFGEDKIKRDLLSLCDPQTQQQLLNLLDSNFRMYRVSSMNQLETTEVYNFEVSASNELDKNFVVFTNQYTPILVSNSHAAVVARGWGKPCVVGAESIKIDLDGRLFRIGKKVIREGDWISIDGTTGEVYEGQIARIEPNFEEETDLISLLGWADQVRKLGVWANADNPKDAGIARTFGAEGIGLARTEHMFFEEERRPIVVQMIMSDNPAEQQGLLDKLLPFQREDFEGLFRVMDGLPVIIRLIDPPMHEFLPPKDELNDEICKLKIILERTKNSSKKREIQKELFDREKVLAVVEDMWEVNPMMGLRGCRAGIMVEGLTEMQTRAIFEAACNVAKEGVEVFPEVMIPLVSHVNELILERLKLEKVAKDVMKEKGIKVPYKFGTMIETPRAALTASKIAEFADFYSFGTNDLTQMTYGVSRDDAEGKFLFDYVQRDILPHNPFEVIDRDGVGQLMEIAVEQGRGVKPDIEIGGCGEHFGEPNSIEFSHIIGLNYVSASPFRVPIARLAAAQAALNFEHGRKGC
jgi:phosphoenolpyruvate synthase/pyruvate phosphate dikinase